MTSAKRVAASASFFEIVSGGWDRNFKVDYTFQFKYRSMAISYYFKKEIICAAIMIYFFREVNSAYQSGFMGPIIYIENVLDPETGVEKPLITESNSSYDFNIIEVELPLTEDAARLAFYKSSQENIRGLYPFVIFLCGALIYSFALKILFNTCAKPGKDNRVPIDVWMK